MSSCVVIRDLRRLFSKSARLLLGWCLLAFVTGASGQEGMDDYRLGPRDVLEVRVAGEEELANTAAVDSAGKIRLLYVDEVKVGGLTLKGAIGAITAAYKDGWLANPQVFVSLRQVATTTCTVSGQVGRQGEVTFGANERLTIMEVLGRAGGLSRIASPKVEVTRIVGGTTKTFTVNTRDTDSTTDGARFVILPKDQIRVKEGW